MSYGSVIIRNDPVKAPERYLLNLAPMEARGYAEARYDRPAPRKRAEGYYWAFSIRVMARELILKELYENGLNRHVESWGFGLTNNFEGYIEEMVFSYYGNMFTKTLRNLANKAWMRADTDGDDVAERTTEIESSDSQDDYGIWEKVLTGGVMSDTVADQTIQQWIDLRAFAQPEVDFRGPSQDLYLDLFVRGYINSFDRRTWNQTDETGTQSLSSEWGDVVDGVGQFIASKDTDANTTAVERERDIDQRAMQVIMDLPRLGDSEGNRWIGQVQGRDCTGVFGRKARLKQAAPVVSTT